MKFLLIFALVFNFNFYLFSDFDYDKTKGIELYYQKKYKTALFFLEKAFKKNPLNPRLSFYLGNIYNQKKMFLKAIDYYLQGLEVSPQNYRNKFLINLAYSYQLASLYDDALRIYSMLEKNSVENSVIDLRKGILFFKMYDKVNLIKSWKKFLLKNPSSAQSSNIVKAIDIIENENFVWDKGNDKIFVSSSLREEDKNLLQKKFYSNSLNDDDVKFAEKKLFQELLNQERNLYLKNLDDEIQKSLMSINIDSKDFEIDFLKMQEGQIDEMIER